MKCEICKKEILRDSQCINYKYYHNDCIEHLQEENKQLKEQLLATQTNEETFRLEMADITKTLGLDEDTIFDDVKEYARNLKDNWDKLREFILEEGFEINTKEYGSLDVIDKNVILEKIRELEGSDINE